jgi:hypothetical protein
MASVFVQIASYHDYELPKTLLSAIETSSGEHQIHFGIHNSYYEPNHIHIPKINTVDHIKISVIDSQAPENIGVGASRTVANSLYSGEDYYFQIDSHSRLAKNWDSGLVNCVKEYQACGVKKPLLTAYPAAYYYDDCLIETINTPYELTNISFHEKPDFSETMIPHQTAIPATHALSFSVSAGSIFTLGDFHKIAVNKKMAFWGEEILIAARAFTNGYDLLIPDQQYVFHLYFAADKSFQHNLRRHMWKDWPEFYYETDATSKAEVKKILSEAIVGDQELGTARTLDEFGEYAGLDFRTGAVLQPHQEQ